MPSDSMSIDVVASMRASTAVPTVTRPMPMIGQRL